MELAALQVTLDGRRARSEISGLTGDLLKSADAADRVSDRGQRSMNNLATAARLPRSGITDLRKEMDAAERETIAWGQATARLMTAQGNLAGAVNTLRFATAGATNQTQQLINAQTQLARLQQQMRSQGGGGGGAGGGGGIPGAPGAAAGGGAGGAGGGASAFNATASAARGLYDRIIALTAAYISFRGVMNISEALIDAQISMQRIEQTLSISAGSIEAARDQMMGLRQEANRIGVVFVDSAQGFSRFSAAAEGTAINAKTVHDTFIAVSEASSRLHLTSDQTRSVFLALEQMISKGTVSMEELRRQLGNHLPGALNTAARAMGVTTKELIEMVKAGDLATSDFLPKFAKQLQIDIPIGDASNSLSSEINRLKNSWMDFKAAVSEKIDWKSVVGGAAAVLSETTDKMEADKLMAQARAAIPQQPFKRPALLPQGKEWWDKEAKDTDARAAMLDDLLRKQFPYSDRPPLSQSGSDLWTEYSERKANSSLDKERYFARNPIQGPQLPTPEPEMTEKQEDALRDLAKLEETFRMQKLEGLAREEAQIDLNTTKQIEQIEKIRAALGDRGNGIYFPEKISEAVNAGEDAKGRARARQGERDEAEMLKAQAAEAEELNRQYRDLLSIQEEIEVSAQPDRRLSELAETNRRYREQHSQLIEIDEVLNVSADTFDKLNAAHQREVDLINAKYERTFVGEGTLSELLERRIELERELLRINESDPAGADRARNIQQEMATLEKQMNLKLQTDTASSSEAFIFGWESAQQKFGTITERIASLGEGLAMSMDRHLTNSIVSWIDGTKTAKEAFADMARAVVADLIRIMVQQLIVRSLMAAFGSIAGGAGGGGYHAQAGSGYSYHTGGIVGEGGSLSAGIFAGAKRYHDGGIVGDEVPVIARKGEGVFTPEQMAAMGGGGNQKQPQKVEIINVTDPRMIDEYLSANPQAVLNIVNRNRHTLKRTLMS